MEILTFIGLVLGSNGIIALLLLVQEVRYFRGETRYLQEVLRNEMLELKCLLASQEAARSLRTEREARERLAATRGERMDAEQRIDVGRVLDEAEVAKWQSRVYRLRQAALEVGKEEYEEHARPPAHAAALLGVLRILVGAVLGVGLGGLLMALYTKMTR